MSSVSLPTVKDFDDGGVFAKETDYEKFIIIRLSNLDKFQQLTLLRNIKFDMNALTRGGLPIFYCVLKIYYSPTSNIKSVFKSFIDSGANVNARCQDRIPLLYHCVNDNADNHNKDIMEFLLENGADVYAEIVTFTAHHQYTTDIFNLVFEKLQDHAGADIFIDIIKLLIDHIDINHRFNREQTMLMRAIMQEVPLAIIEYIIKAGADVQLKDKHTGTALHYSIDHKNNIDVMKLLIANGADVNAINTKKYENSLLMMVIDDLRDTDPMFDAVKLLILAGANVNHRNLRNQSALSIACGKYRLHSSMIHVIMKLLDTGAVIEHEYWINSMVLMKVFKDLDQTRNELLSVKTDFKNAIIAFTTSEALSRKRKH